MFWKSVGYVSAMTGFTAASLLIGELIFFEKPAVARDGFDCEILSVSRKIKAGNPPDFVALESQQTRTGENMILRAMGDFRRPGSYPPSDVEVAYSIVAGEMARQRVLVS